MFEGVYKTSCLLFSVVLFRSQYLNCGSGQEVQLKTERTSLPKSSCKKLESRTERCFPKVADVKSGKVQLVKLKKIRIYSSPLEASFGSSSFSLRENFQRQFTPIDYHAFIVFETDDGRWCSLDKMRDGIYVSWSSECEESVMFNFGEEFRALPIRLLEADTANANLADVFILVTDIGARKGFYSFMNNNCQDFAKEVFNKYAKLKTWDPLKIIDVLNPAKWLSYERLPFLLLMIFIAILGEIYFLLTNYYVAVLLVSMLLVVIVLSFFTNISHIWTVVFGDPAFYLALSITAIFNCQLSFLMKRGTEYCEEFENLNDLFYKFLASPRYVVIYLTPVFCIFVLILRLVDKFVDKVHWRGLIDRISYRCKSHIIYRVCSLNDNLTSNDFAILLYSVFFFVHIYFFC